MKFSYLMIFILFMAQCLFSGQENPGKTNPLELVEWFPITKKVWTVYLEEPGYHFNLAREHLKKGEKSQAIFAIRRGEMFLTYQKNRLEKAFNELNNATYAIKYGKLKNPKQADVIFKRALNVLHRSEMAIPSATGSVWIFMNTAQFHYTQAVEKFSAKNPRGAANELRRCSAFLVMHRAQMRDKTGKDFTEALKKLNDLAERMEKRKVKDLRELEQAGSFFQFTRPLLK